MIREINRRSIKNYRRDSRTSIPPYIWKSFNIPLPIPEYHFVTNRRWRIDYAWPCPHRVAVEIEGGIWTKGRHVQPQGFIEDMEKYNMLSETGWILLRYEPKKIDYEQIKRVLIERSNINNDY